MAHQGFEGLRDWSLKAAAAETAIETAQHRSRGEALQESIEGGGANYVKAVVYERGHGAGGVEIMVPRHVLVYLFEPGEAGEQLAAGWLAEARFQHGVAMRASVYVACTGPLAALPVIGEPVRQSKASAVGVELARAKADGRAVREEAA